MISKKFIRIAILGLCFSGCNNTGRFANVPLMQYPDIIDASQFKHDPLTETRFYQAMARADIKALRINRYEQGMLSVDFPNNLYERVFKQTLKGYQVNIHRTGCELHVKYSAYNMIVDSFLSKHYGTDFYTRLQYKVDSLRKIPLYASMDQVLEASDYKLTEALKAP